MTLEFLEDDDGFDAAFESLVSSGKKRGFISNDEWAGLMSLRDDDSAEFNFGVSDAFEAHGIRILDDDGPTLADGVKSRELRPWELWTN